MRSTLDLALAVRPFRLRRGATRSSFVLAPCAFGLACVSAKCAKPPASGPCADDAFAKCQYQVAYCDSSTMTCVPPKADGQPCTTSGGVDECASESCNVANGENGTCGASAVHCAEK